MKHGGTRVLLTGATGFVGRHAYPALLAAGYHVVCGSRRPDSARAQYPTRTWVMMDLDAPETLSEALAGIDCVIYLVHHLASGAGYETRELRAAEAFAEAASEAGVERVVYLGGVAPSGPSSRHLKGRLETGRVLRDAALDTIELRAGMIIGPGSASWNIVLDLAARLPAMLLPRWLRFRSEPVAIGDVVAAIVFALSSRELPAGWYDIPGPSRLSHRELLAQAAAILGKHPVMVSVPVVSPALSSYWVAWVTRTRLVLAKEIVQGLQADLLSTDRVLWKHMDGYEPMDLEQAMRQALHDERSSQTPGSPKRRTASADRP